MYNKFFKNKKSRLASLLILTLMLSGCGSNEVEVGDDYGVPDGATTTNASTDSYMKINEASMVDVELDWADIFTEDNTTFTLSLDYHDSINPEELCTYKLRAVSCDEKKDEDLVNSLFGDTGKKLESISNSSTSEYIPFIYKYKTIKAILDKEPREQSSDSFEDFYGYINYDTKGFDSIISPGEKEECKWVDSDKYYIHMYEGKYNDMRYGLILAYDKVENTRFIYFKPVNIDEYFPDMNIKTVMHRNSMDQNGYPCIDNICTLEEDELKNQAVDFLNDKLGLSESESNLGNDFFTYTRKARPLIGFNESVGIVDNRAIDSISQMVFTDSDYVHSIENYQPTFKAANVEIHSTDQFPRTVELLSEQDDLMEDALQEGAIFSNALADPYRYLNWEEHEDDMVTYTCDGYALYLNYGYSNSIGYTSAFLGLSEDYRSEAPVSCGSIEVTSKGIFGVDIMYMFDIESVEPASLVDQDTIVDSLKKAVKSDDFAQYILDDPDALYDVSSIANNLIYYYDEKSSMYCPAWDIALYVYDMAATSSDAQEDTIILTPDDYTYVYIDATTGNLLKLSEGVK